MIQEVDDGHKRLKRAYSPQFLAEAAQLVVVSGRPITHVAKELGIIDQTLDVWVKAWRVENAASPGPDLSPEQSLEPREALSENARLRIENEFLKKAAAFFARTQP
ncbi:transposase [Subtercola boreus]|uniref:transposase n=1 Tax=Subtercola boreus TaxID=120213 RepID=UPI001558FA93|nr:transposase [Subtercola boreus]